MASEWTADKLAALMRLVESGAIELPDAETDGKGAGFYADDLKPAYHTRAMDAEAEQPAEREHVRISLEQYGKRIEPTDALTREIFNSMPLNVQKRIKMISAESAADRKSHWAELTIYRKIADNVATLGAEHRRYYVAIANLTGAGIMGVSPLQLYRVAYGVPTGKPTPAQLERQYDCIRDMATMWFDLNVVDIAKDWEQLRKYLRGRYIIDGGQLLQVDSWVTVTASGDKVPFYTFGRPPFFYELAKQIGQVATFDATRDAMGGGVTARRAPRKLTAGATRAMPKTRGGLRNTPENIEIKQLIADRITALKSKTGKDIPDRIPYETFYKAVGIDGRKLTPTQLRDTRKRVRERVKKQLDWLKADGQIAAWGQYGAATRPTGVTIEVNKEVAE